MTTNSESSPTTTFRDVMVVVIVSFLFALLLGARGLTHAAAGMPDGPVRTVVIAGGAELLAVEQPIGLTRIWDRAQAALGREPAPAIAPLLASSTGSRTIAIRASGQREPSPRLGTRPLKTIAPRKLAARGPTRARTGLPRPTRARPLRLLITGDSLTEFLGPQLLNLASTAGPIRGFVDTHYGTGLVRPDYVDWSVVARQQVAADHPQAVVVMMGGNDFQNFALRNGTILHTGTPAWTAEYARRAAVCLRLWINGGARRVYWLSIPPARDAAWASHNVEINLALRRAVREVPDARYLNINGPITDHGEYADYMTVGGQPTLVRAPDGIHLTQTGSQLVAREVLTVLKRDWHL